MLRWLKNPDKGNLPEDEWQLARLVKNPDVSVRMRGVMEKCSLCLQRIEQAKIAAKVKARDSGHIRLSEKEGTVPKTACQQACPAEAIVFGDISDPESSVSKAKAQERTYKVLEFLLTKPRCTYLARVRNPNPEMPDYKEHSDALHDRRDFINAEGTSEARAKAKRPDCRERSALMAASRVLDKIRRSRCRRRRRNWSACRWWPTSAASGWLSDRIAGVIEGETPAVVEDLLCHQRHA